jgi:hypothetical protein
MFVHFIQQFLVALRSAYSYVGYSKGNLARILAYRLDYVHVLVYSLDYVHVLSEGNPRYGDAVQRTVGRWTAVARVTFAPKHSPQSRLGSRRLWNGSVEENRLVVSIDIGRALARDTHHSELVLSQTSNIFGTLLHSSELRSK